MEERANSRAESPKPPGLPQVRQNNSRRQWLLSDAAPCTAAQPQCWDGRPSAAAWGDTFSGTHPHSCAGSQSTTGYRGFHYCHPDTANWTTGELAAPGLTLDISDFPCNQNDNEFENKLSNMAALLNPDELSFGFVTLLFQLVLE